MASVFETFLEQTFSVFVKEICSEAVATNICNTIGACWDPLVKTCYGAIGDLCGAGK